MQSFAPRINRAKADKVVAALIERANAINARTDLAYHVVLIHVFGSYLTDTDDLGDVDICAVIEQWPDLHKRRLSREAINTDKREVGKLLTGGDRYLHLGADELESLQEMGVTKIKQIFPVT